MAPHSSTLAWRIPGTGEPGGLPSMGSHKVGHDCSDLAAAARLVYLRQECKIKWEENYVLEMKTAFQGGTIQLCQRF